MPQLIPPSTIFRDSYLSALQEFQLEGRNLGLSKESLGQNFHPLLDRLRKNSKGEELPEGDVPSTQLWLVEGETYLGRISIRHYLTEVLRQKGGHIGYEIRPTERQKGYGSQILPLGIEIARDIYEIPKVLVTCDADNLASRKIIERSGGVIENEGEQELRFWISAPFQTS